MSDPEHELSLSPSEIHLNWLMRKLFWIVALFLSCGKLWANDEPGVSHLKDLVGISNEYIQFLEREVSREDLDDELKERLRRSLLTIKAIDERDISGQLESIESDPYGVLDRHVDRAMYNGFIMLFHHFSVLYTDLGDGNYNDRQHRLIFGKITDHWVSFHRLYVEMFYSHEYVSRYWLDGLERDAEENYRYTKEVLVLLEELFQRWKSGGDGSMPDLSEFEFPRILAELHRSHLLNLAEQLRIATGESGSASEELIGVLWEAYDEARNGLFIEVIRLFDVLGKSEMDRNTRSECLKILLRLQFEKIEFDRDVFFENL